MLYPVQDFFHKELREIWVYEANPEVTRERHNPDGNPFKTEEWVQFNTKCPIGHKHVFRTYDDPYYTSSNIRKDGTTETFDVYMLKCPDCSLMFKQVLQSFSKN